MNTSCKIIEDLLPLYVDEVCSKESRQLVDGHVAECPKCMKKLKMMGDTCGGKADIKPLRNVGRWLERLRLRTLIKGIVNGVLIMAAIIIGFYFLTQVPVVKISADNVTVSDVCMLSDGNIAFHLYIDDSFDLNRIGADVDDDGILYITPLRTVIEGRRDEYFNEGLFNMYYGVDIHEFDPHEGRYFNPYLDFSFTAGVEPKAVYLRVRGEDILIWEKGMELPAASEEVEDIFIEPYLNMEGNG